MYYTVEKLWFVHEFVVLDYVFSVQQEMSLHPWKKYHWHSETLWKVAVVKGTMEWHLP